MKKNEKENNSKQKFINDQNYSKILFFLAKKPNNSHGLRSEGIILHNSNIGKRLRNLKNENYIKDYSFNRKEEQKGATGSYYEVNWERILEDFYDFLYLEVSFLYDCYYGKNINIKLNFFEGYEKIPANKVLKILKSDSFRARITNNKILINSIKDLFSNFIYEGYNEEFKLFKELFRLMKNYLVNSDLPHKLYYSIFSNDFGDNSNPDLLFYSIFKKDNAEEKLLYFKIFKEKPINTISAKYVFSFNKKFFNLKGKSELYDLFFFINVLKNFENFSAIKLFEVSLLKNIREKEELKDFFKNNPNFTKDTFKNK